MACGCNRNKIKHKNGSQLCPKCKWLMRTVSQYNVTIKKMQSTLICSNKACKFSKSK